MNTTDFSSFPQGMVFLKQFWAQGASTLGAAPASPAFTQVMGQYLAPTMDLAELEKRLNDLKTVLQFMELNTQLLRQSLQALEVQHATLSALKSMAAEPSDSTNAAAPWLAAWQSMMAAAPAAPIAEKAVQSDAKKTVRKAAKKTASAAVKRKAA
jgi:hypothetical protein